ncbi:putative DNA modification/repair radical SAM protein [Lentisalinibacter sediminis]|uniref:putative DNA modification/repair radical SAM protein n=1 Tax=Lentisalinibacter sediminis TaxID=2992237 RepID=UPI00386FA8A7
MPRLTTIDKLAILADAAKYDASCASSSARRKDSRATGGIGSTGGAGICHSYAPDGRCISLLKVLLTNYCQYDCQYCVNRISSDVQRARFGVQELVQLTLEFYKRNYIEGLFLSSGIMVSPDYTMERLIEVARRLRVEHRFRGYIHLKTIPDADAALIEAAGRYADRLSINIELPTSHGLARLAPEKDAGRIRTAMGRVRLRLEESRPDRRGRRDPKGLNATGQSTQMIVGADDADDRAILTTSASLYAGYRLKRVYYSAFSPIPYPSASLPAAPAPLLREHRLYQADWLYRFYGFGVEEILAGGDGSMLDPAVDPKLAWAVHHRERFPVDVNRADRETLLRVPGLGTRAVARILKARRHRRLGLEDLQRMTVSLQKVRPFVVARGWQPGPLLDSPALAGLLAPPPRQQSLPL